MGQIESHQKSAQGLAVLFEVSDKTYEYALAKLEELSKERFKNQVSKWDLMSFLSINRDQVQALTTMLSNNPNSQNLSIHLVMVALVMCQESVETQDMLRKVKKIFELVSFMIHEGEIQRTEVRYFYHLMDLWIEAVSTGSLPSRVTGHKEVQAMQHALEQALFPQGEEEMASLDAVCAFIEQQNDTLQLICLFQSADVTEVETTQKSIKSKVSYNDLKTGTKKSTARLLNMKSQEYSQKSRTPMNMMDIDDSQIPQSTTSQRKNKLGKMINTSEQNTERDFAKTPHSSALQSRHGVSNRLTERDGEEDGSLEDDGTNNQPASNAHLELKIVSPTTMGSKQNLLSTVNKMQNVFVFGQEVDLHWTTDIVNSVIGTYQTKQSYYEHNLRQLDLMQQKLHFYRSKTIKIVNSDRQENLSDLAAKIQQIKMTNIEYIGHRQLPYMMKSFFFQQQLVNTGFSISEYTENQLNRVRASEDDLKDMDEDQIFEDVMTRAYTAQAFKEFYKCNLAQLKYELRQSNAKMLHMGSQRGQQRILEKKKYKTLGELASIEQTLKLLDLKKLASQSKDSFNMTQQKPEAIQTRLSTHQLKANSLGMVQGGGKDSFIPSQDQMFTLVYDEIGKLRSCGMSRRDIVAQMDTKDLRKAFGNQISFWEGVLALMAEASSVKTFGQLQLFRDFYEFGESNLVSKEQLYKKTLLDRQHHRNAFLSYNSQIGKIKGMTLAINKGREFPSDEVKFVTALKQRKGVLITRLEKFDFELTKIIHSKLQRKRVTKQYFKALGKVQAYRTIVKSLPFERIIDFLLIGMAKIRTQDIISLVAYQDRYSHEFKSISEAQFLTTIQKMKSIESLDRAFNLPADKPGQASDPKLFERFQDELNQISEMQRLMGEAPDHPVIDNINQKAIKKKVMMQTVATMLTQQFIRSKHPISQLSAFQQFVKQKQKPLALSLTGSMSYKTLDLEDVGKILFDFIEVEDRKETRSDDLITWLGTLSCSLSQTYFHGQVENLITHSQEAHISTQKFAQNLLNYGEKQFKDCIIDQRNTELNIFVTCLTGANRGHLLNNLDCQFMSMPLEYSLENNFWLVQALSMQLNHQIKEIKFQHFDQVHSPILLSKRSLSLNKKIAAQLILAAFSVGPQSVQGSDKSEQGEEELGIKDLIDFDKQFIMTSGEGSLDLKVKRFLFGDIEEHLRVKQLQTQAVQKVRIKYIQEDGSGIYKKPGKDNLGILCRDMVDEVYDENSGDLNEILMRYNQAKTEIFDQLKQEAVEGVIGGANNFLEKIIKMQTKENDFGQNQTLLKLKEFISNLLQKVSGRSLRTGGSVLSSNVTSPTGDNINVSGQPASRNQAEQTQISLSTVNSDGTTVSFVGGKEPMKSTTSQAARSVSNSKKSGGKSKGKKGGKVENALAQVEEELITTIAKTFELYQMVHDAKLATDIKAFFYDLATKNDNETRVNEKLSAAQIYLKANIDVIPAGAKSTAVKSSRTVSDQVSKQLNNLKVNVDKIGCQVMQDVQAGILICPVHVFQPANSDKLGLPPQYMMKINETQEFQQDGGLSHNKSGSIRKPRKQPAVIKVSDAEDSLSPTQRSFTATTPSEKDQLGEFMSSFINSDQMKDPELSEHQKSLNLTLQFIEQVSQIDDKLTLKMLNKNDSLFMFIQGAQISLQEQENELQIFQMIHELQHELINVFDLSVTPLEHLMKNFQRTQKFLKRDMLAAIQKSDEEHNKVFFDNVIARCEPALIKQVVSRVDYYFQNIELEDHDKLDFMTAQVKIRRELDQKLHTFKEYVDLEENKRNCQRHYELCSHQQRRISQEIASMQIIIRTYYMRQLLDHH